MLDNANGFNVSGSPFAITQGSLTVNDGNGGNNYSITYNSANLTLAAKALAVTADNESKKQGASDPALAYTYSGLVGGDASASFTGGLTRDSGENVGDYTIRIGTLAGTGNYTVGSYNPGVFSILAGSGGNDSLNAMQVAAIVLRLPPGAPAAAMSRLGQKDGLIFVSYSLLGMLGLDPADPHPWWDGVFVASQAGRGTLDQAAVVDEGVFAAALTITGNPLATTYAHTLGTLTYPEYTLNSGDSIMDASDQRTGGVR